MVNFRHRTKGKGKRWKKGHSSSSNPEIKRHRNVAISKFFQEQAGKSTLITYDEWRRLWEVEAENCICGTRVFNLLSLNMGFGS
jgi:hypothetical protein